ncbi:uracil-DNA glycosylase [bacterium]|nr:uracil-DNA glycosylase [candidate division CSSED10-310 bacterium]
MIEHVILLTEYLYESGVDYLDVPECNSNICNELSNKKGIDLNYNLLRNQANKSALENIKSIVGDCTRCRLHENRNKIVFGDGNPSPEIVFVGEGPGQEEDIQGLPFVGRAGKLLDRILKAMGLLRNEVYICNVVKCRPPRNRNPELDEIETCSQFLNKQLTVLRPRIICALGNVAAGFLTGKKAPMTVLRGHFYDYNNIPVLPTYHPAALLRNPAYKRPVWEDMQKLLQYLGRPIRTK